MKSTSETLIRNTMKEYEFYGRDILFNYGFPIELSEELRFARIAFGIPEDCPVYFAIAANTFGRFKEKCTGFAITSDGLYLCVDRKRKVFLNFERFCNFEISKLFSYIKIGGYEFHVGFPGKVANMLEDLQINIEHFK